jgi:hypothetical protein
MYGMKLSIGILAIGSLYWDTSGGRDRWRRDRLQMDKSLLVQVPMGAVEESQCVGLHGVTV